MPACEKQHSAQIHMQLIKSNVSADCMRYRAAGDW